ncbi:Dnah12, partial [Symbiodinium sp. KB8]
MVAGVAADILSKLRLEYDLEAVAAKFPVDWAESMNTVLTQELARFNRLLSLVHSSLAAVQKAMAGLVLMSGALEELSDDLFFGPRLDFFDAWFASGTPCKFWISGFFFTQSFLTGALQNFARKYTVAIDEVEFNVDMLKQDQQGINQPPVDGVYVHGMFLDGARWDKAGGVLAESTPKVLFSSAPVMWLQPAHQSDLKEYQHYACPMYVTSERRGVLRTTGHSSNFVMVVK